MSCDARHPGAVQRGVTRRALGTLLAVVLGIGAVVGHAASLGVSAPGSGSGVVVLAGCDTDGMIINYVLDWDVAGQTFSTTSVRFNLVDADCDGKTASVRVLDGGGTTLASGGGAITVATEAFTVTLDATLNADSTAAKIVWEITG